MFEQTAEWWRSSAPDGRRNHDLYPQELTDTYGGVSAIGWQHRRNRGKQLFPDVPFMPLVVGRHLACARNAPPPVEGIDVKQLERLLAKGGCTLVGLADHFDCSPSKVQAALEKLKAGNKLLSEESGVLALADAMDKHAEPYRIDSAQFAEVEIPVGFVADTHLCSKYARLDVLEDLYDRFAAAGVQRVFHGGNWIDGEARFNNFDIHVHGCDEQVAYFVEHYPRRPGIVTEIVSGDDHEGWYVQREHINIGRHMESLARAAGRDDLIDLGYMERDVVFEQPHGSSRLRVIHAGGGSSYAVSYTSQKYVETLQGGEKPQIVIVGHFHKFDWADPREVDVIQAMCTQDQTPFMRKRRLQAHVGGGIAWLTQNELGIFTSVKVQKFRYYDKAFYAYHWRKPDAA